MIYLRKITDMIQLDHIPIHQVASKDLESASFPVSLAIGSEALQLQKPCGTIVGKLNPHYSKLLRVLQDGESIEVQAIFISSSSRHVSRRRSRNNERKGEQLQSTLSTLSVTLYGSMDMFESVGDFLSQCSEYLQPPSRCDRNVPYYNPQSLAGRDQDAQMTFQFQGSLTTSDVKVLTQDTDPSAILETEDLNLETEAPAAVKSSLYRYVRQE